MSSIYDRIFADVRKDLPSVVDAVVKQEAYRVMDDFTAYTNVFQQECTINLVPNTLQYGIEDQITVGQPNRLLFAYDTANPVKQWPPIPIWMRVPGTITLARAPGNSGSWKVLIAKRTGLPLDAGGYPQIDEWIVQKYEDTIRMGILARLMIEPQKPYSNPLLAQVNQKGYIAGRSLVRVNDTLGNIYGAQAWRYPQTFART